MRFIFRNSLLRLEFIEKVDFGATDLIFWQASEDLLELYEPGA